MAAAKKKASGRNIPEAQRGRQGGGEVQIKLRLPEDVADDLRLFAALHNVTLSGAVALLLQGGEDE